jgi:hypothetical protein
MGALGDFGRMTKQIAQGGGGFPGVVGDFAHIGGKIAQNPAEIQV